jgi:hypothetical protein
MTAQLCEAARVETAPLPTLRGERLLVRVKTEVEPVGMLAVVKVRVREMSVKRAEQVVVATSSKQASPILAVAVAVALALLVVQAL